MNVVLTYEHEASGLSFHCLEQGRSIPVDSWARVSRLKAPGGQSVQVGFLLGLVDDGQAVVDGESG